MLKRENDCYEDAVRSVHSLFSKGHKIKTFMFLFFTEIIIAQFVAPFVKQACTFMLFSLPDWDSRPLFPH